MRVRLLSIVDLLGRLGCAMPVLANAALDFAPLRALMEKTLGFSTKRSLPHYAKERFDRWFAKRSSSVAAVSDRRQHLDSTVGDRRYKGKVILWDDTFVRYHEPHIGIAAVKVLEALGFEVALAKDRQCCGRPAFSEGNLDAASGLGKHNVDLLSRDGDETPIIFLEPSCWSMFVEDYRELNIGRAEKLAARCFLFEQFVDGLLEREPDALQFRNQPTAVAIHAHCHAKSIIKPEFMARLAERVPGTKAILLETGCCGMAGAFGMTADKYELSIQVARDLIDKIDNATPDVVVASGTSCRHQLCDLTDCEPKHMAELFAAAMV